MVQDENTTEAMQTTIAVRDDNVCLVGFKNRYGDWYEFGMEGLNKRLIPNSTFLGCDFSYGALVNGMDNLVNLDLGKEAATRAVRRLWAYQHVGPADVAMKRDLARMSLMICESARMIPHYETVRNGWNTHSRIDLSQVEYIHTWSKMSRALIKCAEEHPQNPTMQGELAVVHLLLNSLHDRDGTQRHQQEQLPTPGGGVPSQHRRSSNPHLPNTSSSRAASSSSGGTQQQGRTAGKSVHGRPLVEVYGMG